MINTNEDYSAILLTLYKGRYDIGERKNGIKGYRVIGEFDYLRIQSLDANLSTENQYKEMWMKTARISRDLNIGESCHNLYAIGKKNKQYLNDFWSEEEYPFLFLSMIQLRMGNEIEQSVALDNIEKFLKTLIERFDYDIKISVYYSLDSCDYILFLKAKVYDYGSKIIQGMPSIYYDEKRTLNYYCYSLCGIDIEEYFKSNKQQIINKIMICFVIKNFDIFSKWLEELKRKFENVDEDIAFKNNRNKQFSYSRLGNEDVCINIINCDLDCFLKELHEENGLLNESNELFLNGLMKLRLHFDSTQHYDGVETNIPPCRTFKTLIERLNEFIGDDFENILYPTTKKALFEVLNSCSYFEQEYFVKDIQVCIQNSFDIFLSKFEDYISWKKKADKKFDRNYTQIDFNNSVIEFINGIMSVMNGALHTDRMFFQAPGFNAVLYDIPAKLLAFYTAFVKKISDILNDNENKEFAYLLCPDLYLKIVLVKLFDNPDEYPQKRLLKGRIPVESIFEPKRLMVELAHEVAHCVGDDIRMREKRMCYTISMFGNTLVYYLFKVTDIEEEQILRDLFPNNGNGEELKRFRESICYYITNWLHKIFTERCDLCEEFSYYQIKTRNFFECIMRELVQNPRELLKYIEKEYLRRFQSGKSITERVQNIYALTNIISGNLIAIQVNEYMDKFIDGIHSLTNESYADMIMCKMLGVKGEEYVYLFYNANRELDNHGKVDFLYENATGERIISVLNSFGEKIEDISDHGEYLYNFYLDRLKNFEESSADKRDERISLPKNVIKDNEAYLKECLNRIHEKKMDEKFEEIRKIYTNVTEQDVFTSVQSIFKIVYEMRISVDKKIDSTAGDTE